MASLTSLGVVHTAVGLVALVSGLVLLIRHKEIPLKTRLGRVYLATTLVTAATGLGIFQHGGFGPPHVLSLMTLLALAVGTAAATSGLFGAASRYVQVVCFSATILFHLIPGFTETLTRLPAGAPLLASAEAPEFQAIYGVLLLLFALLLALQIRWLRRQRR